MSDRKPSDVEDLQLEIRQLQEENRRKQKIIDSLISRVEQGNCHKIDPYGAFQHSVVLAEQVREKTEELNATLVELEETNRQLTQAKQKTERAQQRFLDAIETITDGFALYDNQRRLVYSNSHFRQFWQDNRISLSQESTLGEIKQLAHDSGLIVREYPYDKSLGGRVFQQSDDRWMQVSERETSDGGLVMLYTDITRIKQAEADRFEAAMAEKSRLLQTLIDNLSQGVLMVDGGGDIQIANRRFTEMTGLNEEALSEYRISEVQKRTPLELDNREEEGGHQSSNRRQILEDGRVIEVRSHSMGDGGYVNTYTDITQGYLYAETLRENEQWLRLITDNVPALIAYVGADLHYQFTNKVYDNWYGFERGNLLNSHISVTRPLSKFNELKPYLKRALEGESVTFECEESNGSGEPRHLVKSYVPNKANNGQVVGLFVLNWDITERKRSAEQLKQSYLTLEQRVQERTAQLQSLNDKLSAEVMERRVVESRLLEAKREAERANLSKTKFLAAISHDLLQPLNAAQLYVGSLQEQRMPPASRKLVRSIDNSLADVESLISMLVDISKLDAGVVKADKQGFEVCDLLDNIADEFERAGENLGLEVRYVRSRSTVYTDSQLLARVVRNLMSNALKYTSQGRILLGCRHREEGLSIEVWDTGEGIPESKQREIFQEFKRLNSSSSGRPEDARSSLGLGLAIVDKISKVLGHQISVRSELGKGSVFSVTVPYGVMRNVTRADAYPSVTDHGVALHGARVWVIDNDQNICEAMKLLLEEWGCKVSTASSLENLQVMHDIHQDPVEMLVMDYHLNDGITGTAVANAINAGRTQVLPTLILTANRSEELKKEARESGYLLLNKPVVPMRLKTTLIHLLRSERDAGDRMTG
ncbi:PAS-domain containing protein [Parasalinivibrio latis]|uniref:hybrid sensor histidine kinase/response regulator n=1 Tax=Parasalinivibrio latis TaxID=2952610 RepID=UPI0030E4FCC3